MKKLLHLCFLLAVTVCYCKASCQIPSKRYAFSYGDEKLRLPYDSSHDLFTPNTSIHRVLFIIHSSSYNPNDYFVTGSEMIKKKPQEKERTMIIAPLFAEAIQLPTDSGADFLYWKIRPFWGTSQGFSNNRDVTISAFDVMDMMLKNMVESKKFPTLREIVILGHSAGGQMVNRYAAGNAFEERTAAPKGITLKYVVTAPSSYIYFSKDRPVKGSLTTFAIPTETDAGYNNWGWGMESLYSYHRRNNITAEWMIQQYPKKKVLYLVGSNDNNSKDESLGNGPGSVLQGAHRLARGKLYYNYLRYYFGDEIKGQQYFRVIKGMGHWGRGLMTSPECLKFVFEF